MTIYKVMGKAEGTEQGMVQDPRASNNREPPVLLSLRSRELLSKHMHRELDGEVHPRGSLSIHKKMLSTCNYIAIGEASRINIPNFTLLPLAESHSTREPLMPSMHTHHQVRHPSPHQSREG